MPPFNSDILIVCTSNQGSSEGLQRVGSAHTFNCYQYSSNFVPRLHVIVMLGQFFAEIVLGAPENAPWHWFVVVVRPSFLVSL